MSIKSKVLTILRQAHQHDRDFTATQQTSGGATQYSVLQLTPGIIAHNDQIAISVILFLIKIVFPGI